MLTFDRIDAQRIAISAAGALFFSALCVGTAISPAQAASVEPDAVAVWHAGATRQLDRAMAPVIDEARRIAVRDALIGVQVDQAGTVSAPAILQSSGNRHVDARLLQRAARLKLAPMPAALADTHKPVELFVDLVEDVQPATRSAPPLRYAAK